LASLDIIIYESTDSLTPELLEKVAEKGSADIFAAEAWKHMVSPIARLQ
jgi:hypothetical protein